MAWWNRKRRSEPAPQALPPRKFFWSGRRRYLANAPYTLPADVGEINRLDFQHFMLRSMIHGNYAAPLTNPLSILDVACGTGRWALEMARQFPQANVVGLDITPALTPGGEDSQAFPDNFTFVQGNVLERLPFAEASFDVVHQRLLVFAMPENRWQDEVRELAQLTRPNGWVELVEAGWPQGSPALATLVQWSDLIAKRRGINVYVAPHIGEFLQNAGLQDVQQRQIDVPLGAHFGQRLGKMAETDLLAIAHGLRGLLITQGIVTESDFEATMNALQREINEQPCIFPFFVAYGRRAR